MVEGGVSCVGRIRTPGEKSISHRAVLLGALAEGTSRVTGLSDGADVAASLAAVEAMGARVERLGDGTVVIHGGRSRLHAAAAALDCGNSGTSMRLLTGLVAGFGWETELVGDDSLSARPMDRVAEPLRAMGARVEGRGERQLPPLRVRGGDLRAIDWTPAVASAQVKSAILLAGLSARGTTVVREPVTTRTHTEEMLAEAGADMTVETWGAGRVVSVRRSSLRPVDRAVPGDPSAAAFFVVAGCVVPGSRVAVERVYGGPARLGFVSVLRRMGGRVALDPCEDGTVAVTASSGPLRATEVPASEIPSLDEVPALAVAAAVAQGTTVFTDVGELRVKEVDRLAAVAAMVEAFGATASVDGDRLAVTGTGGALRRARVDSLGDHRMAMASAVAALAVPSGARSVVTGFSAVETSYPRFAEDLASLAGGPEGPRALLVAIDGPAGAGKSTVSTQVAERLGLDRLDTGAMYRAVAAAALARGVAVDDAAAVAALADAASIQVGGRVVIDGTDVTGEIRSPAVGRAVSVVAANPEVRRSLVERQRAWAQTHGGGVVEGRDIGSVVFPRAQLKVYLTASPEERARRRDDEAPEGVARRDRIDSTTGRLPAPRSRGRAPARYDRPRGARCGRGGVVVAVNTPDPEVAGEDGTAAAAPGRHQQFEIDPRRTALYRAERAIFVSTLWAWFRPRVVGKEHVPTTGPAILAPVHRSFADFGFAAFCTTRKLFFMTKDEMWKNKALGRLLLSVGAFPVHRESADREALKRAEEVLVRGQLLVMFPEGTRREGPEIRDLMEGATFLSARTGAPIIPIGIAGSDLAMPKGSRVPKPYTIDVVVGPPDPCPAAYGGRTGLPLGRAGGHR